MSAITFNWAPFEIETAVEAQAKSPIKSSGRLNREEEFRTVLDSYLASYRNQNVRAANKDNR